MGNLRFGLGTNGVAITQSLSMIGESLTFYVNGRQAASAQDSSLTHGDVGVIAGGAGRGETDVRFDNFSTRSP